jgi:hypothetical protein
MVLEVVTVGTTLAALEELVQPEADLPLPTSQLQLPRSTFIPVQPEATELVPPTAVAVQQVSTPGHYITVAAVEVLVELVLLVLVEVEVQPLL